MARDPASFLFSSEDTKRLVDRSYSISGISETNSTGFAVIALLLCLMYSSCKKDNPHAPLHGLSADPIVSKFFSSSSHDPIVNAVKENIACQEQHRAFIVDYVKGAGFPRWDKALSSGQELSNAHATGGAAVPGYQVVYTPFTRDSTDVIGAILVTIITPRDTMFKTVYRWQYNQLPFKTASTSGPTAEDLALFFMGFEHQAFGHSWYRINDTALFHEDYAFIPHKRFHITGFEISARSGLSIEVCGEIYVENNQGQVQGAETGGEDPNLGHYEFECHPMDFSSDIETDGGDGFPGPGNSGSGGTNGGGWNDNPCRSIAAAGGTNPCDSPGGNGWTSITAATPILSYLVTQLDLSNTQISWLQEHTDMQTELYNYLMSSPNLQGAAVVASQHLNGMMSDNAYYNFVQDHRASGQPGLVWWLDLLWLNDPGHISFGPLEGTQQRRELTSQEVVLVSKYPFQAYIINRNVDIANVEAFNRFSGELGINDKRDAFRHAFFSAINTRDCPPGGLPPVPAADIVLQFGTAHESETPSQLTMEKDMDLYNNGQGVNYCSSCFVFNSTYAGIANGIMTLLNNGNLHYIKPVNSPQSDPNFWGAGGVPDVHTATHGLRPDSEIIPTNQ